MARHGDLRRYALWTDASDRAARTELQVDDDDAPAFAKRDFHRRRLLPDDAFDAVDGLPDGDRWSTWDQSSPADRGPLPYPAWLVTDLGATDTELGILKTGKEADVFLLRRAVPDASRSCLLAAKRYRAAENRMFHRDVEYLDGRRVRESRDNRAMAKRTAAPLLSASDARRSWSKAFSSLAINVLDKSAPGIATNRPALPPQPRPKRRRRL